MCAFVDRFNGGPEGNWRRARMSRTGVLATGGFTAHEASLPPKRRKTDSHALFAGARASDASKMHDSCDIRRVAASAISALG
jgi:hypothetical protein